MVGKEKPTICRWCLRHIRPGQSAVIIIAPTRLPYNLFNDIVGKEMYIHPECLSKAYPDIAETANCYIGEGAIVLGQLRKLIKNINEKSLSKAIGTVGTSDVGAVIKEYYRITAQADRSDQSSVPAEQR